MAYIICMGGVLPKRRSALLERGSNERILISRTDRIGDLVLSLPVARMLHRAYPDISIDFLVQEYTAPVLRHQPDVADVLTIGPQADYRNLAETLTQRKYKAVICLYPRRQLAWALLKAKIPIRIGTSRRWYSYLFTHRVVVRRRDSGRHEKDLNLDLLGPLGIEPDYLLTPELSVRSGGDSHDRQVERMVVIHPGDGGSAVNWRIERYVELAGVLKESANRIIVTGLAHERERHMAAFAGIVGEKNVMTGRTDLIQLMNVLADANLFVGGSTGPLHLAAAMGVPVVGLFGPIRSTTPDRWGPCGHGHRVFVPDVPVCRCSVDSCRLGNCMDRIPLGDVAEACRQILSGPGGSTCCQPINKTPALSDVTPRET
jgi:heptosyltransferase-3